MWSVIVANEPGNKNTPVKKANNNNNNNNGKTIKEVERDGYTDLGILKLDEIKEEEIKEKLKYKI